MLILEAEETWNKRLATTKQPRRAYARMLGYGASGDAFHVTSPSPEGRGAEACMRRALRDANLLPHQVGYVNAHATSTPMGDDIEAAAIARVFKNHRVAVSSTKGATGHLLGEAGAVELAFTALALHHGVAPPTLNLKEPQVDMTSLDMVVGEPRPCAGLEYAMSNSFGFGGVNVTLVVGKV